MLIADLQNRLRVLLRERIETGALTGTELANRAGFQQAHVSNFLNERRGLSIEAMDRVMKVMGLVVRDLLPADRKAIASCSHDSESDSIPVVVNGALSQNEFGAGDVIGFLHFKKSFLRRIRTGMASHRENWQRFVLIKADKDSGEAMRPRLLPGATVLIDRHYNSLQSYRRREPNMYVVKSGDAFKIRYLELQGGQLTLRPENQTFALGYVQLNKGETFADYVVGRVAHISIET